MRKYSLIFVGVGVLALAGLFWLFSPETEQTAVPASPGTGQATTVPSQSASDETPTPLLPVRIEIRDGRRVSGPELIRVRQGEEVRLAFLSDRPSEIHLHGYDLTVQLQPGEAAELSFTAQHSGRFEYELHGQKHAGHHALGAIEVLPK